LAQFAAGADYLLQNVQTGSKSQQGPGDPSSEIGRSGHGANYSPRYTIEVKN